MKLFTIAGTLGRVYAPRVVYKSDYKELFFEVTQKGGETHYFETQQFKNGGNLRAIKAFSMGDKIEVLFSIKGKPSNNGLVFTDLLVKEIKMLDDTGTQLAAAATKSSPAPKGPLKIDVYKIKK